MRPETELERKQRERGQELENLQFAPRENWRGGKEKTLSDLEVRDILLDARVYQEIADEWGISRSVVAKIKQRTHANFVVKTSMDRDAEEPNVDLVTLPHVPSPGRPSKVDEAKKFEIQQDKRPLATIAAETGLSIPTISRIRAGRWSERADEETLRRGRELSKRDIKEILNDPRSIRDIASDRGLAISRVRSIKNRSAADFWEMSAEGSAPHESIGDRGPVARPSTAVARRFGFDPGPGPQRLRMPVMDLVTAPHYDAPRGRPAVVEPEVVEKIRKDRRSLSQIARDHDISRATVSRIKAGTYRSKNAAPLEANT